MKSLLASLDSQRRHVLGILEGLDDSALRRPVLPSGWTCLGLVNHLAVDVERFWFAHVIAGQPFREGPDAWRDYVDTSVFDLYRKEIALADEVLATVSADDPPRWWPDFFGDYRLGTVGEVVLHVITETACHAGHLDAARELADGRQWMVVT